LKIAAKPLQMETWLLLTFYRNLPPQNPMILSRTLYNLPFKHNIALLAYHIVRYDFSRSSKDNS